jgi:hypothetical protein
MRTITRPHWHHRHHYLAGRQRTPLQLLQVPYVSLLPVLLFALQPVIAVY